MGELKNARESITGLSPMKPQHLSPRPWRLMMSKRRLLMDIRQEREDYAKKGVCLTDADIKTGIEWRRK